MMRVIIISIRGAGQQMIRARVGVRRARGRLAGRPPRGDIRLNGGREFCLAALHARAESTSSATTPWGAGKRSPSVRGEGQPLQRRGPDTAGDYADLASALAPAGERQRHIVVTFPVAAADDSSVCECRFMKQSSKTESVGKVGFQMAGCSAPNR